MLDYISDNRKSIGVSLLTALMIVVGIFNKDQLQATTFNDQAPHMITKMILSERGGEIRMTGANGAYDYFLRIPPGGLESDTRVTLATLTDGEAALKILPEGLSLVKPAVLTMIIKPVLLKSEISGQTGIHYYDEASSSWQYQHGLTYETVDGNINSDTLIRNFSPQALGGTDAIQKWSYEDHYE